MRRLFVRMSVFTILLIVLCNGAFAQIYEPKNVVGTSLENGNYSIETGRFNFVSRGDGLIDIYFDGKNQGKLGMAVSGIVNSTPQYLLSWDADWNWQVLNSSDTNVVLQAQSTSSGFTWVQQWSFQPLGKAKLQNTLINNTGFNITNTNFYYAIDLNDSLFTDIGFNSQRYQLDSNTIIDSNLNSYAKELSFAESIFGFQDLIDGGFDFSYFFAGNLNSVRPSLPNSKGVIIGVTKNGGVFPNGATAVLDPLISTTSTAAVENFQANTPALAYITPQVLVNCYLQIAPQNPKVAISADGGTTWTSTSFDLTKGYPAIGDSRIVSCLVNPDNNMVVVAWDVINGSNTDYYITQGDYDSNLLLQSSWEIPYKWTSDGGANKHFGMDINSTGQIAFAWRQVPNEKQLTFRYFNADLNVAAGEFADVNIYAFPDNSASGIGSDFSVFFNDSNTLVVYGHNNIAKIAAYSWITRAASGGDTNVAIGCNATNVCFPHIVQSSDGNIFVGVQKNFGISFGIYELYRCIGGSLVCSNGTNSFTQDANVFGNTNPRNGVIGIAINPLNKILLYYSPYSAVGTANVGYSALITRFDTNALFSAAQIVDSNMATGSSGIFSYNRKYALGSAVGAFGIVHNDQNITINFLQFSSVIALEQYDSNAPATRSDINANWQNVDANVHLTCVKGSAGNETNCQTTIYRLDTDPSSAVNFSTTQAFDVNIYVTRDGNWAIDFNSTDLGGNAETTKRQYILVDKTNPTTTSDANAGWKNADQNVHLTCSDENSGCKQTYFQKDTDATSTISLDATTLYDANVFFPTDGNFALRFFSSDNADNNATAQQIYILKDTNNAVLTHKFPNADTTSSTENSPTFTFRILDTLGGAKSARFHYFKNSLVVGTYNRFCDVNADNWCNFTVPTSLGEDDTAFIHIDIITDNADNNATTDTNTGIYTYNAVGTGTGSGGGGSSSSPQDTITIISPTGAITLTGYPGYRNRLTFTIRNETTQDRTISFRFDETIEKMFKVPEDMNLPKNSQKNFVLEIVVPDDTIPNIYTGLIEVTDNTESPDFDFTITVAERDLPNFLIALLSGNVLGIPNIVILIVIIAIGGFIVMDKKAKKKYVSIIGG